MGRSVPRTLDIMGTQGFLIWRLGFLTRRTSRGGRRMGFCGMVGDGQEDFPVELQRGAGREAGLSSIGVARR